MTRTLLALALLMTACDGDDATTADASVPSDAAVVDARTRDAPDLYEWERYACEEVPTCVSYPGPFPACPSVGDYIATMPGDARVADCRRWLRCPVEGGGICLMCREWSSSPMVVTEPDPEVATQAECSEELCPVPDGGTVRECGDAG